MQRKPVRSEGLGEAFRPTGKLKRYLGSACGKRFNIEPIHTGHLDEPSADIAPLPHPGKFHDDLEPGWRGIRPCHAGGRADQFPTPLKHAKRNPRGARRARLHVTLVDGLITR